jgi:hypothetical protein
MLSRALSLATVTLLIGCFTVERAQAQAQNLEAGKSPSQIFAGTCSACHKSPRGLLKTVPAGSLPGFLRQHYTTSPDMANVLSSYLASNGATDTRYVGAQKGGKDGAKDGAKEGTKDGAKDTGKDAAREAKSDPRPSSPPDQLDRFGRRQRPAAASQETARPESRPESQPETRPDAKPDSEPREAARPDAEEAVAAPQAEPPSSRTGRNAKRQDAKRLARPAEAPEEGARSGADGRVPAQAAIERGPDGRRLSAKQKLSKRGRAGGEDAPRDSKDLKDPFKEFFRDHPKPDTAKEDPSGIESPSGESAKVDSGKPDFGKPDFGKPDFGRPDSANGRPEESARPSGDGPSQSAKVDPAREGEALAPRLDAISPANLAPPPAAADAPPAAPAGPPTPPISQ